MLDQMPQAILGIIVFISVLFIVYYMGWGNFFRIINDKVYHELVLRGSPVEKSIKFSVNGTAFDATIRAYHLKERSKDAYQAFQNRTKSYHWFPTNRESLIKELEKIDFAERINHHLNKFNQSSLIQEDVPVIIEEFEQEWNKNSPYTLEILINNKVSVMHGLSSDNLT